MAIKDVVKYKLDRLISILLTNGVQPSDIADNIFLKDYTQISYRKCDDKIIGEITIKEIEGAKESSFLLRYVYSKDKQIERIEEEKQGNIIIQWDRNEIITNLINDIVDLLKSHYTKAQMNKFLKTLPNELQEKIIDRLYKVA